MRKKMRLFGSVAGEMRVEDVPLSPGVNLEALKKGDEDPLEVVVEIPASKSKRGWNYTGESLKNIVDAVMDRTLNGFLGHQKPDDVNNVFESPVTHWVGAKMEGDKAFFRGVVDAAAKDLKRWIRSNRIKQVSIFGMPKLQRANGETNVVGYEPLSIDWTPLDRAGMNTRIVATAGEMWDIDGNGPTNYDEGGKTMDPKELMAKLKEMLGNKQITIPMIAGEMGWKAEEVAGEVDTAWLKEVTGAAETMNQVRETLGITGEMDVVAEVKKAKEAMDKQATADHDKVVGEMLKSKLTSEAVKKDVVNPETVLGKMWELHRQKITPGMELDKIAGEVDAFLNDSVVKTMVSQYHTDKPAGVTGAAAGGSTSAPQNLKVKRTTL